MARLQIDGIGTVDVGDGFDNLTPDQQNNVVAHIAAQSASGVKSSIGGP
jgi:hypothetical protein